MLALISEIRQMENLQKLFHMSVRFPFLLPLVRQLIKLPPNPLFQLIFKSCYALQVMKRSRINIFTLVRYAFTSGQLFSKKDNQSSDAAVIKQPSTVVQ